MLQGSKNNIVLRAKILKIIREFFEKKGFIEVETPVLLPCVIPEAHIDPIKAEQGYLHTSPELCMKVLLSMGYGNMFQICKCFRKGEMGRIHLPEFTMLEWYHLGIDYNGLMDECEELIFTLCKKLLNREYILYLGNKIELSPPWERITLKEVFSKYASVSLEEAINRDIFEEIMVEIEPKLGIKKPVFIKDYPASMSLLAKLKGSDLAERFELYIGGLELANGYTELTNAKEIKDRLEKENRKRAVMGKESFPVPAVFLKDLPECSGIAMGIDRLVMLFSNSKHINEVVTLTYNYKLK